MDLPEKFQVRMKALLQDEYDAFKEAMQKPAHRGFRRNPLKCSFETLTEKLPFSLTPSPFSPDGYCIPNNIDKIGSLPLHHAGAFYVQEPSATSAVTVLNPLPGDRVLDLCAAPGGKSTQIAGSLMGEGLLWSNEIVRNRALVLLSNIERLGVSNAVVSSCHPEQLCKQLAGYFDKVLVDAPCSGEGMFLHDPGAIEAWSEEHVASCAMRQSNILESASTALKPEGILVYSTCTYSVEENENVILDFLKNHSEFTLLDCGVSFGRRSKLLPQTLRIFPMDGGDGHFVAKLKKNDGAPYSGKMNTFQNIKPNTLNNAASLYREICGCDPAQTFLQAGDSVYLPPEKLPDSSGLYLLRAGVLFAKMKNQCIRPAHHFFMANNSKHFLQSIALSSEDEAVYKYLRGEEIDVSTKYKGYAGVSVDGVMLGFGKISNGKLKNHYPKGLRNH